MKRQLYLLLLLITTALSAQELRTSIAYDYKLNKKNKLELATEWRLMYENNSEQYLYFNLNYSYKINKRLKVKIGNRYAFETDKPSNNRYRAVCDLLYHPQIKFGKSQVDNRLRLQYARADWEDNDYTLRERIRFNWPLNKKTSPYLSFEALYTFDAPRPYEGRMALGSNFEIGKIDFELYYKIEIAEAYKTVLFHHVVGIYLSF